jgi:hypothetical protein
LIHKGFLPQWQNQIDDKILPAPVRPAPVRFRIRWEVDMFGEAQKLEA